ncbi:MAG: NCS2 family permease [Deltaproteobacteria bacterium]|nr:NCS2 family permease [Deltaproteobacteria bacterium]
MLERLFALRAHRTTVRQEVVGGATTFLAMAYIVVLNPAILSAAGIPHGPETIATILTATFGSLLMGFWANRPIAVAPYMGENAFLAFGLAALGISWQARLGTVFVSGLAFLALVLFRIGPWLSRSISPSLKHSFGVGIGLFLLFLGLHEAGLVVSGADGMPAAALLVPGTDVLGDPPVPLKIGALHEPRALLAIGGVLLIVVLQARRITGAVLISMIATGALGIALGLGEAPRAVAAMPFQGDLSLGPVALHLDVAGVLQVAFLPILLTLFLVSFLDSLGSLVGLGAAAGLLDEHGDFPEIERPLVVNALSCVFGSLIGTSTSGAYIESGAGIREGARTGLAAVTTGLLFAATLFFVPLVEPLQHLSFAYAPALISVGIAMLPAVRGIDFDDPTELLPAMATLAMMVFTFNIANGLTAGLALYPIVKVGTGRAREVSAGAWLFAALCFFYYTFGLVH